MTLLHVGDDLVVRAYGGADNPEVRAAVVYFNLVYYAPIALALRLAVRCGYVGVYLANSVSFLAFAAALASVPLLPRRPSGQSGPGLRGYVRLLGARPLRRLLFLQFLIVSANSALFLAIGVFSVGECLYTPAFQTVLLDMAGDAEVGRYAALTSMTWTTVLLVAPTFGIALVQLPWPAAYWLTLALGGLVVAALSAGIGSSREAQRAHPAGEPR